jgi:hypothetical protein
MNDSINVTNTGTIITTMEDNGVSYSKGQGLIMRKDGEMTTWTTQIKVNVTEERNVALSGVWFYSASSTGNFAFLIK